MNIVFVYFGKPFMKVRVQVPISPLGTPFSSVHGSTH